MMTGNTAVAPYIRRPENTNFLGAQFLIALLPAFFSVVYFHHLTGFLHLFISLLIFSGVEYFFTHFVFKNKEPFDFFCLVDAVCVVLILPTHFPIAFFIPILFFLSIVGRQLLERKLLVFLPLAYIGRMIAFVLSADVILAENTDILFLLSGKESPLWGAECTIALLLGFSYLLFLRWIRLKIVMFFYLFLAVGFLFLLPYLNIGENIFPFFLVNSVLFFALFTLTDPRYSPTSFIGQILAALFSAGVFLLFSFWDLHTISVPVTALSICLLLSILRLDVISIFLKKTFYWRKRKGGRL